MRKFFGTDGIRGKANTEPLTPPTLTRLGQAIGRCFMRGMYRHRVVIGKDTRLSGYMVESALAAGFVSVGMDVIFVGPLPTPAIAMLTRSFRADLGVMISASHNPFDDNGIKLFDPLGFKLSDQVERAIEEQLESPIATVRPLALGEMRRMEDAVGRYVEFIKSSLPRECSLEGMRIVVDCANGAAYKVGPLVLRELGATVISIGAMPNGRNINKGCGTMHPQALCAKVQETKAHVGIAFDGDADRVLFVDEKGGLVDGDHLIALLATTWKEAGTLKRNTVVGTLMSNLALEEYLNSQGISLLRAAVGDRYIAEKMREETCNLGGEPSGHIVLADYATGGDGLLSALQILGILVKKQRPASEVLHPFKTFPQILKNVPGGALFLKNDGVQRAIEGVVSTLHAHERVLVRPSGTEPFIRIMAEGRDEERLILIADRISKILVSFSDQAVA